MCNPFDSIDSIGSIDCIPFPIYLGFNWWTSRGIDSTSSIDYNTDSKAIIMSRNETQNMRSRSNHTIRPQVRGKDSLDRFGDDLCRLLLSYLPLEDRFRYECVSKQWQRLIYETQTELSFKYRSLDSFGVNINDKESVNEILDILDYLSPINVLS
ncbi:unnamed protein product [Oppiella nova]|uniref:F-box domain-containing protein n=1 Tax=Oppiella nova TaxID=334625 RepID=A0A7R9LMA6_9ACAR|nr:unnamed protein product [Oppiella nova]CAG2165056.1 unnamed protein product [Oppiella nova]